MGPSQHSSKNLREIIANLYSFNGAITNLQSHLVIFEEDQARLQELAKLQEPLKTSMESLDFIKQWLEDASLVHKYLLGGRFDKKVENCMRSLNRGRDLLQEVIQSDNRSVYSSDHAGTREIMMHSFTNFHSRNISIAIERYVRNIAEDVRDMQNTLQNFDDRSQQNHQETRIWQAKMEQKKQGISSHREFPEQCVDCSKLIYDLDEEARKILDWLSPLNFARKQKDTFRRRHEQTGDWFLKSSEFQTWITDSAQTLFCPGIPGAGKTILASVAVDYLRNRFDDAGSAVVCVFCNHADEGHQRHIDLVASILEQLLQRKGVTDELMMLYQRHQSRRTHPEPGELLELLYSTIQDFERVFVIIDALDECPETTRKEFVNEVHRLRSVASLLITSRQVKSIEDEFHDATHLEIHALDTDLEIYIRTRTQQDHRLVLYMEKDPSLQEEIVQTILGNARGM